MSSHKDSTALIARSSASMRRIDAKIEKYMSKHYSWARKVIETKNKIILDSLRKIS